MSPGWETLIQASSQELEKWGGGFFKRVRKVQTTLTRIFIVLESVSHGLSKNWDGISRKALKFKRFFRSKTSGLQKKGLRQNWVWFFGQNRKFKQFFSPKIGNLQKQKQKKGFRRNWVWFFGQLHDFGTQFPFGGLFSIFHQKSA